MMKQIKQVIALFLACCLLLSGCGKISATSDDSSTASSSAEKTEEAEATDEAESGTDETPTQTTGTFSSEQGYSDINREVSVLGLKEYKKIKSDQFTDKASDGCVFLVLFLEVRNLTEETVYFHADYLSAELDGEEITHTVLLNDPEDYPTMFSNIAAESYYGGFIVWEVPENWETLDVTYEGWEPSDGLTLTASFTRDDLSEPDTYSTIRYDQSGEYD